jgi:osmotically-inducible protein OsmY
MRNSRNGNGRTARSSRQFPEQNQHSDYRGGSQTVFREGQGRYNRDDQDRDLGRYGDRDYERGGIRNQSNEHEFDRNTRGDYGHNSYTENEGYDQGNMGPYSQSYDQEYDRGGQQNWRGHDGGSSYREGRQSDSEFSNSGGYSRSAGQNSRSSQWSDNGRRGISSFDTSRSGQWGSKVESMRGKGPKGYRRSDERIQEELNDTLTDDDMLDASDIEVTVKNGEVTLSGTVNSREAKHRAEDIAEGISGIVNVENRIRVSAATSETKSTQDRGAHESDKVKSSQNKTKAHQNAEA